MENHCPNCQKDLSNISNKSILNVFNIGNPSYQARHEYCSDVCVETKIRKAPHENNEYFPIIIPENVISAFMKSKTGEYAVIVDLPSV